MVADMQRQPAGGLAPAPGVRPEERDALAIRRRVERMLAWSGVPFIVLFFAGLLLVANFVPPPSPSNSAEATAALYRDNTGRILVGLALCFLATPFFMMFAAGLLAQTRRIEGVSPGLTYLQLAAFSAGLFVFLVPIAAWWAAAYRADTHSPELIQGLNDFAAILFVGGFPPFVTWCLATGLAIFSDTSSDPIFPRWAAYGSFLVALVQVPPILLIGFYDGPFAWDGLFSWWLPLTEFFLWIVAMLVLSVRAAGRRDREASA